MLAYRPVCAYGYEVHRTYAVPVSCRRTDAALHAIPFFYTHSCVGGEVGVPAQRYRVCAAVRAVYGTYDFFCRTGTNSAVHSL